MDFINRLGDTIVTKGKEAADKAKETAEILNLKSQIATCEEVIRKNYYELGKYYFEQHKEDDAPEEGSLKQFEAIRHAQKGIQELQKQIDEIKGL